VDELVPGFGPVLVVQALTPVTPVKAQLPLPVGAAPPEGPVTVAVNEIVDPRVAEVKLRVTETLGDTLLTYVVYPDVSEVPK